MIGWTSPSFTALKKFLCAVCQSIRACCNTLLWTSFRYGLSSFNAFSKGDIIENGIASDRTELIRMLDYKMRMDSLMQDKMMAAYEEDIKGIQMYDTAMSAIVMIPTQDQSMQFYMSRTKTGMDNMAIHADGQLLGATERMEKIEYNTYLTGKMSGNAPAADQTERPTP